MKVLAVIPSRLASKRLPNKPLINMMGKPIIQYVYEGVVQAKQWIDKIVIATDSDKIKESAENFGAEVMLTSKNHINGTSRIMEVLSRYQQYDLVLNIQGDEPLVNKELILSLIAPFKNDANLKVATLAHSLAFSSFNKKDFFNPNTVKVVVNSTSHALYFSRSPIPYFRNKTTKAPILKHIGLYAFKVDFLMKLQNFSATPSAASLATIESLEQLQVLEMGEKIFVATVKEPTIDINTPRDIKLFKKYLKTNQS